MYQVHLEEVKHTKFEVFQDKAGEYRWYLKADNGEIIADSSEGYANKKSALHGIDLIRELNPKTVTFEDMTMGTEPVGTEATRSKFEVFQDKAGEYRWYLKAANGEIIADSSEGYANKVSALHGIDLIRELNPKTVTFEDLTEKAAAAEAATAAATAVADVPAEPVATQATPEATVGGEPMGAEVAVTAQQKSRRGLMGIAIVVIVVLAIVVGLVLAVMM